jgi:hypothetical protein
VNGMVGHGFDIVIVEVVWSFVPLYAPLWIILCDIL